MFERPILIFSKHCGHCSHYMNVLAKHPNIDDAFAKLCIDVQPSTRQRPRAFYQIQQAMGHKITDVPTIIVDNGSAAFAGQEAFKWLEYQIKRQQQDFPQELIPFNPNEMGAFSDQYSKFGSTTLHDASEQAFKFLGKKEEHIITPKEDVVQSMDMKQKQMEREQIDHMMQRQQQHSGANPRNMFADNSQQGNPRISEFELSNMMNTRQNSMVPQGPRQNIDFTNTNFGFASQMSKQNGGGMSQKARDIDKRLQDLMSQREDFSNTPKQPKHIDWTTGQVEM